MSTISPDLLQASPGDATRSPPLSEQAYWALRERILSGDLSPGERLRMEVLQQQHSLSSSPLREALNRLVAEGLVTSDERRGFRVAPMSAKDLQDITNFRLLVEPEGLSQSIAAGDDAWEGRILSAFHQLQRLEQRSPEDNVNLNDEWTGRHKAYHMALLSAAPAPRLLATCASLFDQAERYRRLSARNRGRPRNTGDEHLKLMEAVLERRTELACAFLKEHISQTTSNVLNVINVKS